MSPEALIAAPIARARDATSRLLRDAMLTGVAAVLALAAYGLGLGALVLEAATRFGLPAALGLAALVTAVVAVLALAVARRDRSSDQPEAPEESGPPERPQADPVSMSYALGRDVGAELPPLALLGIAAAAGLLAGRSRR